MFGGENGAPTFPLLLGDFQLQYATDASSSAQLQLLSPCFVPVAQNNVTNGIHHPKKKLREGDKIAQIPVGNFMQTQQSISDPKPTQVSTGLRLAYDGEKPTSSSPGSLNLCSLNISEDLSAEMKRQKNEFDHFIRVQEEQFAQALKEMKQRHMISIINAIEERLGGLMRDKDAEIGSAHMRNKQLLDNIKQLAVEAQAWHNRAKYNEAMVNTLRINLQQAVAHSREHSKEGCGDSEVDDAASSHCGDSNNNNSVHDLILKENKELKEEQSCKICKHNHVNILLLPCRHLCLCKSCESMLDVCPLCRSLKSASIQVYMS